ncbi:MAG: radical SAM protein [Candidatus Lokiarchaeota archaeon]|nr:radical SAM protein [Candidatus Lokiarchaeota archaeon]
MQRGPWRITFDTNPDTCNLHCMMCEEHSLLAPPRSAKQGKPRLMPFKIIEGVVGEAADLGLEQVIPSTMGEPLLYPDFARLLDLVKRKCIKLNLTTNGTFPRLGARGWARKILPVASDVKISINGACKPTAEAIMEGIDFDAQRDNIKEFLAVRDEIRNSEPRGQPPTVTFQVTFMRSNLDDLPGLLQLAIDLGIDRFKGHHVWITHEPLLAESLKGSPCAVDAWNTTVDRLKEIQERARQAGKVIKLENVFKLDPAAVEGFNPEMSCPFLGKEAWIAWDGTFNVCCAPDPLRRTLGTFGNVLESGFIPLWNSAAYSRLLRDWRSRTVCATCNMRRPAGCE